MTNTVDLIYLDNQPIAQVTDGVLSYLETDHLGTPRLAADPATNDPQWQWDFFASAFGENAAVPATTGGIDVSLRYPGQVFDAETGLHYNYFRDYESGTGRYVESDPIGLEGGLSSYAYVLSDPLSQTDELGLLACGKGGRRNIGTEGFSKKSNPADVARALKEALKNGQKARAGALRGLLKVIKRGGGMSFVIDPTDLFREACGDGDLLACKIYCKLSPEDEDCKKAKEDACRVGIGDGCYL